MITTSLTNCIQENPNESEKNLSPMSDSIIINHTDVDNYSPDLSSSVYQQHQQYHLQQQPLGRPFVSISPRYPTGEDSAEISPSSPSNSNYSHSHSHVQPGGNSSISLEEQRKGYHHHVTHSCASIGRSAGENEIGLVSRHYRSPSVLDGHLATSPVMAVVKTGCSGSYCHTEVSSIINGNESKKCL